VKKEMLVVVYNHLQRSGKKEKGRESEPASTALHLYWSLSAVRPTRMTRLRETP